jgi:hypothetical protein
MPALTPWRLDAPAGDGVRHRAPVVAADQVQAQVVVRVPHRPLAPAVVAFQNAITQASRSGITLPEAASWLAI